MIERSFLTLVHFRNLWNGNIFLKPHDLSSHEVMFVDWTHAQLAPLTTDVIHVLFTCCDTEIAHNITEPLNSYYDYLKGYLATHQLDRVNFGLDFDCFWNCISKTLRAEFVEEAVIAPLVILCGDIDVNTELSTDDLADIFDNVLIEEDVLPLMQMAM